MEHSAEYSGYVPKGVDKDRKEVIHVMKYIQLLINDKVNPNKGPFVI